MNDRTDFYSQLYIELSMLHNTLQKLAGDAPFENNEAMQEYLRRTLGTNLELFENILQRILQSIDDIVSDKSLGLQGMVRTKHPCRGSATKGNNIEASEDGTCKAGVHQVRDHNPRNQAEPSRTISLHQE